MAQDFTREELQAIWERAADMARDVLNPAWRYAYEQLAWACCTLDAFMARAEMGPINRAAVDEQEGR